MISSRPGRGRCYFSNRAYVNGEVILEETPFSFVVADSFVGRGFCAYCLSEPVPGVAVFASGEADWARYCSAECMQLDLRQGHAHQVAAVQELIERGVAGSLDAMRLVLKIAGLSLSITHHHPTQSPQPQPPLWSEC